MAVDEKIYTTEQESFWAGPFGNDYAKRNASEALITSNVSLFSRILASTSKVQSIVEFGCNTGLNFEALRRIDTGYKLTGYEINENSAKIAAAKNIAEINNRTILEDLSGQSKADLAFTKGVLIHINPDQLRKVYDNLYALSKRYIMVCEYYNPTPVTVSYRGETERLFKRDFAGELIDAYDLQLVDYGFVYHRDLFAPADDPTWFLLEKT